MATGNGTEHRGDGQGLIDDPTFLRDLIRQTLQTILEEELTAHLGRSAMNGATSVEGTGMALSRAH